MRKVTKARPGVAGLIREIRRHCEEHKVPVSRLAYETQYSHAARLLSDSPPKYIQVATEEKLREWLRNEREGAKAAAPSRPDSPKTTFEVEVLEEDLQLGLIHAMRQVLGWFEDITEPEERRAAVAFVYDTLAKIS